MCYYDNIGKTKDCYVTPYQVIFNPRYAAAVTQNIAADIEGLCETADFLSGIEKQGK